MVWVLARATSYFRTITIPIGQDHVYSMAHEPIVCVPRCVAEQYRWPIVWEPQGQLPIVWKAPGAMDDSQLR